MNRLLLILTILMAFACHTQAQRMPFFTHYYDNPFLYNPAYAGYDKHSVFYLTHRQQWLGVEGAPVSSQLTFHSPVGNANPIFIGADIANDRIGAINHTAVKVSLAYLLPLSSEHEHYIKTAFSTGIGMHAFDFADMDIADDPVLQAAMGNRTYLDGRFGLRYHNRGFNLSIALPHLFTPPPLSEASIGNVGFDQLSRMIFSTHYRINFNPEGTLSFEPMVLYHYAKDAAHQLEALGIFRFKESFWAGGGFQQQGGFAGTAGIRVKNLKFSYAFATAGSEISAYGMGTHEVQLGLIIGKKKEMLKRKPRLSTRNSIDVMPDEVLLQKHAKSRKKTKKKEDKKEAVPDRKRVNPAVPSAEPKQEQNLNENQSISKAESEEKTNSEPAAIQQEARGKQPVVQQPTDIKPAATQKNQSAASPPKKKVDYSKMDFESFKSEQQQETIQLDEQPAGNKSPDVTPSSEGADQKKVSPSEPQQQPGQTPATSQAPQQAEVLQPVTENSPEDANKAEDLSWEQKTQPEHPLALKRGFYIIAGTFTTEANARKQVQNLNAKGLAADLGYHSEKEYYYVHLLNAASKEEALQHLQELKQDSQLKNLWILEVKE
ncbi:MAG: PorP/SprF family type IX secretion system membrane protein [Cyclobacteriaceae bacterium]